MALWQGTTTPWARARKADQHRQGATALRHRALLVIDDGVATGLTVRAALQSLRLSEPSQLVLAVPVRLVGAAGIRSVRPVGV